MIPQRRKSYETRIVGSEKLAECSANTERAWWRLSLASDGYGTIDLSDVRRLRFAILAGIQGFETNADLERAITELIDVGLMVEWSQQWSDRDGRFLHIVDHDEYQTEGFLRDRARAKSRPTPVPPFGCCDHGAELGMEVAIGGALAILVPSLRCNAAHCHALPRIATHASNPASALDAPHCPATPSRGEVGRREEGLAADPATWTNAQLATEHARQLAELKSEELFVAAADRVGAPQPVTSIGSGLSSTAAVGPHQTIDADASIRPDRPSDSLAGNREASTAAPLEPQSASCESVAAVFDQELGPRVGGVVEGRFDPFVDAIERGRRAAEMGGDAA